MNDTARRQIPELTGKALDWAVAKCEHIGNGTHNLPLYLEQIGYHPSSDWSQGGPIIEREWLDVTPWPNESEESYRWQCRQHDSIGTGAFGPTPLVAAMRCYVASKLGDVVEVPAAILKGDRP